jgi:hypothetical protein
MQVQHQHTQDLFNKISKLPPDKLEVVRDFVEFIRYRDNDDALIKAAGNLSKQSFQNIWDNSEDADYDNL